VRPGSGSGRLRAAAVLEAAGAALLAGGGALAFAEAGAMRDAALHSCAQLASSSPGACDAERVPVRAWDWVAIGAWAGAGTLAALAVVSWSAPRGVTGSMAVGPGGVALRGEF
jgi:hypothetical protein